MKRRSPTSPRGEKVLCQKERVSLCWLPGNDRGISKVVGGDMEFSGNRWRLSVSRTHIAAEAGITEDSIISWSDGQGVRADLSATGMAENDVGLREQGSGSTESLLLLSIIEKESKIAW